MYLIYLFNITAHGEEFFKLWSEKIIIIYFKTVFVLLVATLVKYFYTRSERAMLKYFCNVNVLCNHWTD